MAFFNTMKAKTVAIAVLSIAVFVQTWMFAGPLPMWFFAVVVGPWLLAVGILIHRRG